MTTGKHTTLIAEISTNHGGSWDWIVRAIDQCAAAGVDVVKGQAYQVKTLRPGDPQAAWFRQSELSLDDLEHFYEACHAAGVTPMMSVFDCERPKQLADMGYKSVKVGAGDSMRDDLMMECVKHFWTVYYSVSGLGLPARYGAWVDRNMVRLHSVSNYPTSPGQVEMLFKVGPNLGYSDHTVGLDACKLAIALGAVAVEKHLCLDTGRVNVWDTRPSGFAILDEWRRSVTTLMGTGEPQPADPESVKRFVGRWTYGG
jgi:N,N'-diacetyllegionaminate synthase